MTNWVAIQREKNILKSRRLQESYLNLSKIILYVEGAEFRILQVISQVVESFALVKDRQYYKDI